MLEAVRLETTDQEFRERAQKILLARMVAFAQAPTPLELYDRIKENARSIEATEIYFLLFPAE